MFYDLELTRDHGLTIPQPINSDENIRIKKAVDSIADFKKRLIFYNENIQSLAVQQKGSAQLFVKWDLAKPPIEIYCDLKHFRKESGFGEREKIYTTLRNIEVKRIAKGIKTAPDYKEKLQFLFNTKGFHPRNTPIVYGDIPYDAYLHNLKPIIDLTPNGQAEIEVYNGFVTAEFDRIARNGSGFSKYYKGFDFEKEKDRLHTTLKQSVEQKTLLKYLKQQIEQQFNYLKSIMDESKETRIVKEMNERIDTMIITRNLFARLVLGTARVEPDLTRIIVDLQDLNSHIHIAEIYKFYCYLKDLSDIPEMLQDIAKQPEPSKKQSKLRKEKSFEDYLTDEGKQILPGLIKEYKNSKPIEMAFMMHAMNDLTTLITEPISNIYKLHRILNNTFDKIGTYQAFRIQMRSLKEGPNAYQSEQIATHKEKIKAIR